jgi:hypothetical protein
LDVEVSRLSGRSGLAPRLGLFFLAFTDGASWIWLVSVHDLDAEYGPSRTSVWFSGEGMRNTMTKGAQERAPGAMISGP